MMTTRRLGFPRTTSVRYSRLTPNISRIVRCSSTNSSRLQPARQFRDRGAECLGDNVDVPQGDVTLPPFNPADVSAIEPGDRSERFLRQALCLTPLAHSNAETRKDVSGSLTHGRKLAEDG